MFLKGSGEGDRAIGKSGRDPFTIHSATSRRIRDRLDKVQRSEHHCDTSIRCASSSVFLRQCETNVEGSFIPFIFTSFAASLS